MAPMEARLILQASSKAAWEVEEVAAVLLDLAAVPRMEMFEPRSMLDLRQLRVDSIRRGREIVLRWDAEGNVQGFLELDAATMELYRAHAARATTRYSSEPMSEAICLTKYAGESRVAVMYVPIVELTAMVEKAAENRRPLGVPVYVPNRRM